MICWMESPNVIKYLNEDPNIVPWLKRLNASTPEPMLNYHFNRMGRSIRCVCACGFENTESSGEPLRFEMTSAAYFQRLREA